MADAQAALATPSRGRPNQPLISAGVAGEADQNVEIASASSGVRVSPTPRIIAVSRMKTKVSGIGDHHDARIGAGLGRGYPEASPAQPASLSAEQAAEDGDG